MEDGNVRRIIFIEDMDADFELAEGELRKHGVTCISRRVETSADLIKALDDFNPDIVISDYSLPQFNGMEALHITKKHTPDLPFIILTGTLKEDLAIECMHQGATGYVIKEHIDSLSSAVNSALAVK